eukprot:c13774_g1_i1.p1 GENE.c13774_g1_i1~~c13774_g1_i1.p1  ORF type:complete len:416 (+),score=92.01 c13774_g1_i1:44-1291(+)
MVVQDYVPNRMIRSLHAFPHLASSSNFDQNNSRYLASIGLLGTLFFLTFIAAFTAAVCLFRRKAKALDKIAWRILAVSLFLLAIMFATGATVLGWNDARANLHKVQNNLAAVHDLADQFSQGSDLIALAGQEFATDMFAFADECPKFRPIAVAYNASVVDNTEQFKLNTKNLPAQLEDMRPALRKAIRWVTASLAVPLTFLLIVSAIAILGLLACGWRWAFKLGRVTGLAVFMLCGLFVAAEVSASVMGADVCIDARENVLNLALELTNNRTYLTLKYYATCEGISVIQAPLEHVMTNLSDLGTTVENFNCTASKDNLIERIQILQVLLLLLDQEAGCEGIHQFWVRIVHENLCDSIVPGVAWLWIGQYLASLCVIGGLCVTYWVSMSYRLSIVWVAGADETTPLRKKSTEYIVG